MVQLHFFWNPICNPPSVPCSPQPATSLTSYGATASFLVKWCLLFRQSCLPRKFNGVTAPFPSLNGVAAPLQLPESMGLCVVNGLVVGAVCGGHAAVGYNLELMLPGAFLWCGPTLFSFPIDLTHAPNRARLLLFLVWCCQFSFCWIPPSYQSPISGRFLMLHFLFFFSLKISFP